MSDLVELAHEMVVASTRAALCRDMGEHGMAEHFERKAADAQAAIERLDAGIVSECGVS